MPLVKGDATSHETEKAQTLATVWCFSVADNIMENVKTVSDD